MASYPRLVGKIGRVRVEVVSAQDEGNVYTLYVQHWDGNTITVRVPFAVASLLGRDAEEQIPRRPAWDAEDEP